VSPVHALVDNWRSIPNLLLAWPIYSIVTRLAFNLKLIDGASLDLLIHVDKFMDMNILIMRT